MVFSFPNLYPIYMPKRMDPSLARQKMLDAGIAKECARFVLPLATPTRLYMTGSVRSWIHYIDLRSSNGTQKEHMQIAHQCAKVISEVFPLAERYLPKK